MTPRVSNADRQHGLPRLPFQPLLDAALAGAPVNSTDRAVMAYAYMRLGVTRHLAGDYTRQGVTVWQADVLACRLGLHVSEVFEEWFVLVDGEPDQLELLEQVN